MIRNWVTVVFGCVVCGGLAFAQDDLSKSCKADQKTDLAGLAQTALAIEWGDAVNSKYALNTLGLLAVPSKTNNFLDIDLDEALKELKKGARPDPPDKNTPLDADVYQAASGQPDFLDWVATANRFVRGDAKPVCVHQLMDAAKPLIDEIFVAPKGVRKIVEINDLFTQKRYYAALYFLLSSFPKDPYHNDAYAKGLEILRAAFAADPDRLAKLVSDKISSQE